MAKFSKKKFDSLVEGIEWSENRLQYPRDERVSSVREFVGMHYQTAGADRRVVTPFMKLSVGIFLRLLAARAPRAFITTRNESLRPMAKDFELAVNEIPEEIRLQETLRRAVLESLFSFCAVKIGLSTTGSVLGRKVGEPFVDVVTLDELVIDMSAKHISEIQYIGNTYWVDYDVAKEIDGFDGEKIKPDEYTAVTEGGTETADGVTITGSPDLFREKVMLRDVYVPSDDVVITYAVTAKKKIRERNWKGKPKPYVVLGFDEVPGNLLPVAPVSIWKDLHELSNRLFRKLGQQADGQKDVLGFDGGNEEAVTDFKNSGDRDGMTYTGRKPELLSVPGVDQGTLNFFLVCKDLYSFFAGNLESLGGLAATADTLGQDKLVSQASSSQIRDMADAVIDFAKEIFKALAFYEWKNPVKSRVLQKPIDGTDIMLPVEWSRETRLGKMEDYKLDIDVYSMQDNSPSAKLQKLGMIMQSYVLPLMPAIEAAGGQLDVQALLRTVAELSDFPELSDLVLFVKPDDRDQAGGLAAKQPMPAQTVRRQERVSFNGGPTGDGQSKIMQQIMAGAAQGGNQN